jgi:cAMP-dependent protein kinase regulator
MEYLNSDTELEEYIENNLKGIIEPLLLKILKNQPQDISNFSLDYLIKLGGYTANGLTIDEKRELVKLRKEVNKIRDWEEVYGKESDTSEDEDVAEDYESDNSEKQKEKRNTLILRGPRIAVSAESYGDYNKNIESVESLPFFLKSEEQINSIKSRILSSFLFNSLESDKLEVLINAMQSQEFTKGEFVIKQGDVGTALFIVETGELMCYKSIKEEHKLIRHYHSGEVFGELALLYNTPRAADVVAGENVILWKLDRGTFNFIVKKAAV